MVTAVVMAALCIAVNTLSFVGFLVFPAEGAYARLYALASIVPYAVVLRLMISAALRQSMQSPTGWKPNPAFPWLMLPIFPYSFWLLAKDTSWFTSGPTPYAGPLCVLAMNLCGYSAIAYTRAMAGVANAESPIVGGPRTAE